MKKKISIVYIFLTLIASGLFAQSPGDYRSKQTGLWSAVTSWETYNGSTWVAPATVPSSTNGIITVLSGHIITSNAAATVDQIKINTGGSLVITAGIFTLNDGTGSDLDCSGTFELGSGTLNGAGAIAFNANSVFNWTGGTAGGNGTINISANATFNLSDGNHIIDEAKVIDNYGVCTWTAGNLYFGAGTPVFNNYGSFNIYTNADAGTTGAGGVLNNKSTGIINKIGSPTDETFFNGTSSFNNTGTINVNSSRLQFYNTVVNTGTANISFGAHLEYNGGTVNFNTGTAISGDGSFNFGGSDAAFNAGSISMMNINISAGTVLFTPALTITTDHNFNLSGGTVNTTGILNFSTGSNFNWAGGILGGNGVLNINAGAAFNMTDNVHYLSDSKVVNNYGTGTWSEGIFYFYSGSPVINNYNIFNINTDADAGTTNNSTGSLVNKATGVINKIGSPTDETVFNGTSSFTNAGTINVNSGKLRFDINVTNTGAANIGFAANLEFFLGITNFNAGTMLTGDGNLNFNGAIVSIAAGIIQVKNINVSAGSVTLTPALTLDAGYVLNLSGGTLLNVNGVTFNSGSAFNWLGGTSGGNGTITVNAGAVFNMTEDVHYLTGSKVLNNYTNWSWTGGALYFYNGSAVINNYAGFDINTDEDVLLSGGTGIFNNKSTATIIKNGSVSEQTFFNNISSFTNAGIIHVVSGMLQFYVNATNTGTINIDAGADINFTTGTTGFNSGSIISGEGDLNFDGATVAITAGSIVVKNINISNGIVTLTPSLTINADNALSLSGGTFNGAGNITFSSGSTFAWSNGFNGGSGTITINSGAALIMESGNHYLLDTKSINNYGEWTWTAGPFVYYTGSVMVNNYGNFYINTDQDISSGGATGSFNNKSTGNIYKTGAPSDRTAINGITAFNNEGSVTLNSGNLELNIQGTHSGIYETGYGTELRGSIDMAYTGNNFTNNGGVTLTALSFNGTGIQYLRGEGGYLNTLTINNIVGVIQTELQTVITKINIRPNSRLTASRDLNINP